MIGFARPRGGFIKRIKEAEAKKEVEKAQPAAKPKTPKVRRPVKGFMG